MNIDKLDVKTRKRLLWVLLILNMAAIFALSSQPADVSTEKSDVLVALPKLLFELANPEMAGSEAVYLVIQFIVRKTAHVLEFATLSALAAGLLLLYEKRSPYLMGALFSMLYAVTDEWHQTFIPGREGKISDWCFDSAGAVLGAVVLWAVLRHWYKKKAARRSKSA